jgi:hypothetical protein
VNLLLVTIGCRVKINIDKEKGKDLHGLKSEEDVLVPYVPRGEDVLADVP